MTSFLLDANVWLALAIPTHVHYEAARTWFDAAQEPASVLFCRTTQQSFLRLVTNPSVVAQYGMPVPTNREAWQAFEALLDDDRIALRPDEPAGLEQRWRDFAVRQTASPKLWMDAYLAAFASAAGFRLVTLDTGFKQFPGLDLLLLGARP